MNDKKRTTLEEKWAATEASAPADEASAEAPAAEGQEISELRAEIARLQEQVQRRQAELVNFRRRTDRERAERRDAERASLLGELLPVVDDFERAVEADDANPEAYRQGVELILRSLQDHLLRLGLSRLEPVGEAFDPNVHEAVERQVTSEVPEGHVAAVYKPGYMLGERLVRPAMVAVAAAPADDTDSTEDES